MSNQYNDAACRRNERARWTAEKNAEFYPRVAAGDAAAREEMIDGNMPLAVSRSRASSVAFRELPICETI